MFGETRIFFVGQVEPSRLIYLTQAEQKTQDNAGAPQKKDKSPLRLVFIIVFNNIEFRALILAGAPFF